METTERNTERAQLLFEELGGTVNDGFPAIHSQVHHTEAGTPYLKTPGVVVLAKPQTNVAGLGGFLEGFDPDLRFPEYLDDPDAAARIPPNSARRLGKPVTLVIRPETNARTITPPRTSSD